MTCRGVARACAVALVVAAATGALALPSASASPPSGLTSAGRTLWQFEALLRDTFGTRHLCPSGRWGQYFTSGTCSPLAVYSPYSYVFAARHRSAFHLSRKRHVGGFGNYPIAVFIRGHPVACDARETRFLVLYRDSPFTLGCSRPGYVIS